MFSKIKKITKLYKKDFCYDIQIEDTSSYFSNGILSHNSTAIVESVVYSLFGQTTKKAKAEQVVNNRKKKNCFVEISFDINRDNYVVKRYRLHDEFGNKIFLLKNNVDISSEKMKDTQSLIESIIKISFKSFILSIVLSQEKMVGFAENDPIERRKIIESLLMYEFISKYSKVVRETLRIINPEIENQQNSYRDKKDTTTTLTSNLLKYVEKWETEEANKKNRIESLKRELEERKKINPNEELSKREELRKKLKEKETLVKIKEQYESSFFDSSSDIQKLKRKVAEKEKEIEEINKKPKNCPVCDNPKIKEEVFQDYLQKKITERDEAKNSLVTQEENSKNLKLKIDQHREEINSKTNEIVALKESILSKFSDEEIQHLREKITSIESEINVLSSQIVQQIEEDEYIKNTQVKIAEIEEQARNLKKKIKKLEGERGGFDWWREALGNSPSSMKSFCVNHILPSLDKYINYYLSFFGYDDINYNLDNELEETIIKDGEEITFGLLSGGEKRSVEISLVFALYEIVRLKMPDNINIIVLDEILSNYLDEVRTAGTLDLLSELENRGLSIFVIDHRNLIKENLDCKVINVVKEKDATSSLELS